MAEKPKPEIGSDAWIAQQIALGLPPEEKDNPRTGDGQTPGTRR